VDNRKEVCEFLTTRRARLSPQQAGIPPGANRRVPGLRRAEVAMLADVSVEYYAKLERGALAGVSDGVLDALARALRLDDAEREHLFHLARAASGPALNRPRRRRKQWTVRPGLRQMLDAITAGPAFVRNGQMDILATNALGRAFWIDALEAPGNGNVARFNFLDPRARDFYPDWDGAADVSVAIVRTEAGRDPYDKSLQDLVGELSTRSEEFRRRWGAHNVRRHGSGTKSFHHRVVGDLTLAFEGMELTGDPGLTLTVYTAQPGSASDDNLRLLASWVVTTQTVGSARPADQEAPTHGA
jgi:transcriptional regulator with XRE-family HTH domain